MGFGFPQVGQGVDENHESNHHLAKDLEAEFDAVVELSNRTFLDDGGFDEDSGSDNFVPLPLAEPTAGSSSEPTSPSRSPGNASDQSGSSITVTPISKDMKRRRISIKRGHWEVMSAGKSEKLNPIVFVNNPCLTEFKNLPKEQKLRVITRMRVKRHRQIETMKKGLKVAYRATPTFGRTARTRKSLLCRRSCLNTCTTSRLALPRRSKNVVLRWIGL